MAEAKRWTGENFEEIRSFVESYGAGAFLLDGGVLRIGELEDGIDIDSGKIVLLAGSGTWEDMHTFSGWDDEKFSEHYPDVLVT